jgi:hypothetical protein
VAVGVGLLLAPIAAIVVDQILATGKPQGADGFKVGSHAAPLSFATLTIRLEPIRQLLLVKVQQAQCSNTARVAIHEHLRSISAIARLINPWKRYRDSLAQALVGA